MRDASRASVNSSIHSTHVLFTQLTTEYSSRMKEDRAGGHVGRIYPCRKYRGMMPKMDPNTEIA